MGNKAWKSYERRVASFFNTTRRACSGGNSKSGDRDDIMHDELFVECKHNKYLPLHTTFQKALQLAKKNGKIPVLALHQTNMTGFYLSIRSEDIHEFIAAYYRSLGYRIQLIKLNDTPSTNILTKESTVG